MTDNDHDPSDDSSITMWICSSRCWQEGGPHDEHCRPIHFDRRATTEDAQP